MVGEPETAKPITALAVSPEQPGPLKQKVARRFTWNGPWMKRLQVAIAIGAIVWSSRVAYAVPVGREYLLQIVSHFGNPGIAWVRNCLSDDEHSVRLAAYDRLEALGSRAVPVLLLGLKDKDPTTRLESVLAIGYIGPPAREAGADLIFLTDDADSQIRATAMLAMCRVGVPAEDAYSTVNEHLLDPASQVRQSAARAAAVLQLNQPLLQSRIEKLLTDVHPGVRATAADTLGITGTYTEDLGQALKKLGQENDLQVQESARRALYRLQLKAKLIVERA